jgi:murein DD-endopeptidase MepM/ murein hydrolase activator NlpD
LAQTRISLLLALEPPVMDATFSPHPYNVITLYQEAAFALAVYFHHGWGSVPEVRLSSRTYGPRPSIFGDTPALNADARTDALVHAGWFTALILMSAAAAALMLGALHATLGLRSHFAAAPALFRRAAASGSPRKDRLASQELGPGAVMTRLEQIDDQGLGTKPFTHIILHPGETPDQVMPATHELFVARAKEALSSTTARTLPPEIVNGTTRAIDLPPGARAFASVQDPQVLPKSPLGEPLNLTVVTKTHAHAANTRRLIVAKRGDTLTRILDALGASPHDIKTIVAALSPWPRSGPRTFTGGETIILIADNTAQTLLHPLSVSIERQGQPMRGVALTDDGRYVPVAALQSDRRQLRAETADQEDSGLRQSFGESLRESLYGIAQRHQIDRSLIDELVRLCAHDVDVETPISRDDLVELLSSMNEVGEPELAFAALTLDGRTHRYYRFTPPDDDSTDYYDADGHSVTQFLLRKPVAAGRLGDGFGWRIHPILMDRRFHEGVDYAAPFGSPVVAAGVGMVEKIDQQWGYGRYIRIRHDFGYETTYAHIAGMPRELRVGSRVHQGQTIAYVGSTGLSTGPHLYYELRINGRDVDPLRVRLRSGRVLDGAAFAAFQEARDRMDVLLKVSDEQNERRQ